MFPAIAIGTVGGFVLGSIYGKYVLADFAGVKAHISKEIGLLKTAISTEFKKL
jgi:hypothetical protein